MLMKFDLLAMIWWFHHCYRRSEIIFTVGIEMVSLVLLFAWLLLDFKQFKCSSNHAHRFTRVRRLAIDIEPQIAFDMELVLPFPMFKGVEVAAVVHVPFVISIHEDLRSSKEPDQMQPHDGFGNGMMAAGEGGGPQSSPSYRPAYSPAFMPSLYEEAILMENRTDRPRLDPRRSSSLYYENYRRIKRQLRVASAHHRYDIFTAFSGTLSR